MKPKNYGFDMPREMEETQEWLFALDAYDYNSPNMLACLIQEGNPIPSPYQNAIADIIRGDRKPNKKAASKLKVSPTERLEIASGISIILGLMESITYGQSHPDLGTGNLLNDYADKKGIEPIDAKREREEFIRDFWISCSQDLGVSIETLENLVRDLRRKADKWPNV